MPPGRGRGGLSYTGGKNGGLWRSGSGKVVGRSDSEDSPMTRVKPNGRNYSNGKWTNNNGTTVGRSTTEDSEVTAYKSTGDTGAVSKYIAQRKRAGAKGY